jgi:hypothetical protein
MRTACSAKGAASVAAWGNRPRILLIEKTAALKARLTESRVQRSGGRLIRNPGALPQAHQCGAPLALSKHANRTARAILCSMTAALSIAAAKDRHCQFRVHIAANLHDTAAFATSVPAQLSGQKVSIERAARITESDVTSFYPYHAADGSYGALVQLDEHGRVGLEALSIERRGGLLFVFLSSRPITELQIDKRVSDGKIYIASGLTEADIKLMKKDWRLIGQKKQKR